MPIAYKREPLTREETKLFEEACITGDEKLLVFTLLDSGLRLGEFIGLVPASIEWQHNRAIIYGKGNKWESKKRRVVPLSDRSIELLRAHFALNNNKIGIGYRTAERMVKRIAERAHITKKMCPHVLRHTFAVLSILRGVSISSLMKVLGHDWMSTTQIYLNMSPEEALREFKEKRNYV